MKNKLYLLGITLVILFTLGAIFKIMHFPGAAILLVISLSLFSFVFCPLAMLDSYKGENKHAFIYWAGALTIIFNFIGALFKIMHWPGASILLVIAIIIPFLLFLPAYLFYLNKTESKNLKNLISVLFILVFVAAMDAMMALNVSKSVLNDSALINDHYTLLAAYYEKNTANNLSNADSANLNMLNTLTEETDELIKQIHDLKRELLVAVNEENINSIGEDNKIDIRLMIGMDNKDASSHIMLHEEKALNLKTSINNYKTFLYQHCESNQKEFINKYLNTDDFEWEGDTYSWENVHFEGTMLVWAINHLTSLEFHVRMVESELAESLANRS